MSSRWFAANNGNKLLGPVDGLEITNAITLGRIPPTSVVLQEGKSEWLSLATVKQFAEAIRGTHPPPPIPGTQLTGLAPPISPSTALAPLDQSTWHVRYRDSNPIGPFTNQDLARAIRTNQLDKAALISRVGEQAWVRIADIPAFSSYWPQVTLELDPTPKQVPKRIPTSHVVALTLVTLSVLSMSLVLPSLALPSVASEPTGDRGESQNAQTTTEIDRGDECSDMLCRIHTEYLRGDPARCSSDPEHRNSMKSINKHKWKKNMCQKLCRKKDIEAHCTKRNSILLLPKENF